MCLGSETFFGPDDPRKDQELRGRFKKVANQQETSLLHHNDRLT